MVATLDAGLVVIDATVTNGDDEMKLEGDMKFSFRKKDAGEGVRG